MKKLLQKIKNKKSQQMEFELKRSKEPDRNYHKGGRSFYFFDFDDNIAFLKTPVFIFHKKTKKSKQLSSADYAINRALIGGPGPLEDYELCFKDTGSFRGFRDPSIPWISKFMRGRFNFVQDIKLALRAPDLQWKGPSWDCFYHATFNHRPMALITARGHHPETIKRGLKEFVNAGFLPHLPNLLDIYPVNHVGTREKIGGSYGDTSTDVAELKKRAIRMSVERAFEVYGKKSHHRFGMSDDDPKNLKLITEEMTLLKRDYPENSFFVISTEKGEFVKKEIFVDHIENKFVDKNFTQLSWL